MLLGVPSLDQSHPDFSPSLFAHKPSTDGTQKMNRYQRRLGRSPRTSDNCDTSQILVDLDSTESEVDLEEGCVSVGTDMSMADIECLQKENMELRNRVQELERVLEAQKGCGQANSWPSRVLEDEKHLHFYTGLPAVGVFLKLLAYLIPLWGTSTMSSALSPTDQFLMVLMKLRLGLHHQDLAYRFNVSCGTVSKIFHDWLDVMARELQCLIRWPSRKEIRRKLPLQFRKSFKRVRCIIDCTEIFTQRPTSFDTRAVTYSHYKSHNTIKFLVAVSPTGTITFLSKVWGGRASDKLITKKSGLIHVLEQGDDVMADRGFNFPEYFSSKCVRLLVPASTRGRRQLSGLEVSRSRKMSRLRIHVERAIGRLKSFQILQRTLPVSMIRRKCDNSLCTADKLVIVCGALSNLGKPLVKPHCPI